MLENTWNNILSWFHDRSERAKLVRSFNGSARNSFISGQVPTLLKASVSKGESAYRHQFSNWLQTGFRIQAFSGKQLTKEQIKLIGSVVLNDDNLVRKLIVLGWDTLEIHGDVGGYGLRWQLKDYIALPEK